MYINKSWHTRIMVDSSVIIKDDTTKKVYKVKDVLHSHVDAKDSLAVLTKSGNKFNVPVANLIIVPTPKAMEQILHDKKLYLESLEDIALLEENFKLRKQ